MTQVATQTVELPVSVIVAISTAGVTSVVAAVASIANTIIAGRNAIIIATLEKNTNSIKDELVRTTRVAAHAEGVLEQKEKTDGTSV